MESGETRCICRRPTRRFNERQGDDKFKYCAVCNGSFIDSQKESKQQWKDRLKAITQISDKETNQSG